MSATNLTKPPKASRVTSVQVPGEQPKAPPTGEQPPISNQAIAGGLNPHFEGLHAGETQEQADARRAAAVAAQAHPAATPALTPALDIEAMRAQIRAEEMGKLRAELGQQIQAAASVVGQPAVAAPRSKAEYRTMRAADIDPATLTAPVMTLDGYLCPPAPEAKK